MEAIRINARGEITVPFFKVGTPEIDLGAVTRLASGKSVWVSGDPNRGRFS